LDVGRGCIIGIDGKYHTSCENILIIKTLVKPVSLLQIVQQGLMMVEIISLVVSMIVLLVYWIKMENVIEVVLIGTMLMVMMMRFVPERITRMQMDVEMVVY
jgi:hypothetical protein